MMVVFNPAELGLTLESPGVCVSGLCISVYGWCGCEC